jgi:hypothetical protein
MRSGLDWNPSIAVQVAVQLIRRGTRKSRSDRMNTPPTEAMILEEAEGATPGFSAYQWTGLLDRTMGSDPVHQGSSTSKG